MAYVGAGGLNGGIVVAGLTTMSLKDGSKTESKVDVDMGDPGQVAGTSDGLWDA